MKIPLSWLNEYVELPESPREIAERLTFSGTEVEAIHTVGNTYEGFVVAEVREVRRHPNADRLSVCRVFNGASELEVVCGAPNVRAGGRYALAGIGATLPDGSLTIRRTKIRGVESFGMLCAPDELGISDDHSGLLEIGAEYPPGTPLVEVLGGPEVVLEVEITPNRPDCLCLLGIARELAALYGRALKRPAAYVAPSGLPHAPPDLVRVDDAEACPRYTARLFDEVRVGPSPVWMRRRLERAGIRSINNVVDITNYVLLETGHPLHAFDRDLLKGGRVCVRRAREGERLRTLDGVERELDSSMLVIADDEGPVAVAGVMGGAGSEIRPETRRVLLESAWFDPNLIRATARKLGLATESSYRFERGVDIETVEWASRRAALLLVELAGARPVCDVVDTRPSEAPRRRVRARYQRVRDVLGLDLPDARMREILASLEINARDLGDGSFEAEVPSFRGDLEQEIDFVEEIARIHGLDAIPVRTSAAVADAFAGREIAVQVRRRARDVLCGLGASEIMNYSLVSDALLDLFLPDDKPLRIPVPRPLSADQSVLRTSLIPQMVETLGRNRARQIGYAAFYEIGRVFLRLPDGTFAEAERLCLGLMGPVGRPPLDRRKPVQADEMFLWAKGILEAFAGALTSGVIETASASRPWASPGLCATLSLAGRELGVLGIVDRRIRKEWRLNDPVAVAELDLGVIVAGFGARPAFRDIPAYPSIARDVAMIVPETVAHSDIVRVIREAAPPELEQVELFDVFKGPAIGEGRKSVAYSLVYRSGQRTLTDDEANAFHDRVKSALREKLGAEIRE